MERAERFGSEYRFESGPFLPYQDAVVEDPGRMQDSPEFRQFAVDGFEDSFDLMALGYIRLFP